LASATAQNIERQLKGTNSYPNNGSGLICQHWFVDMELKRSGLRLGERQVAISAMAAIIAERLTG